MKAVLEKFYMLSEMNRSLRIFKKTGLLTLSSDWGDR